MNELRPWSGFDRLVDSLATVQAKARDAAARSIDEILTLRNWLIGAWIVAYEQEGATGLATAKGSWTLWRRRSKAEACKGSRGAIFATTARSP